VGDAEALEPSLDRRAGVGEPVQPAEEVQELDHPQPLRQGEVTGREADVSGGLAAVAGQAVLHDLDPAGVGGHHAEQHQQGGGLAGAVGAEERDALAGRDREVEAVDGADPLVLLHQAAGA
jgi:hypothetical protein